MPALPPVDGVAKVVFSGTYRARRWANIMHVQIPGDIFTPADAGALATSLEGIYNTRFTSRLHSQVTLSQVQVTDLTSDLGAVGTWQGAVAMTAADTNGSPAQVAFLASWKTARRWRGGHPRTYFPGVGESAVDEAGTVLPATVTAWNTALTGFLNDVNALLLGGQPYKLVCVHYHKNGAPLDIPQVDAITGVALSTAVATQRRRLRS